MSLSPFPGYRTLVVTGMAAALALTPVGQVAYMVALVTYIGVPIGILIALLPSIFLILLAIRLIVEIWRALRSRWIVMALIPAIALAGMMDFFVFRAWRISDWLEGRAAALAAGDRNDLAALAPIGTLAVLRTTRQEMETACDDLCRRLLLTGAVTRILELTPVPEKRRPITQETAWSPTEWPPLLPTDTLSGTLWRLERRDVCSTAALDASLRSSDTATPLKVPGTSARSLNSAELMRLRVAGGECLVGEPATLAAADTVLVHGTIRSGTGDYSAGFRAWTDTLSAWHLALWQRDRGVLVEKYRQTSARWHQPFGVMVPTFVHGYGLAVASGWARTTKMLNRVPREDDPPVGTFVSRDLHLDVLPRPGDPAAPPEVALRAAQAEVVDRILAKNTAPSSLEMAMLKDYQSRFVFVRRGIGEHVAPDDVRRVLEIVAAERIDLQSDVGLAVHEVIREDPTTAPALASALWARLSALPEPTNASERLRWSGQINMIAGSLDSLPDDVLRLYRAQTLAVMRDRARRPFATNLLRRLDAFGQDILPDLHAMMDDAVAQYAARDAAGPRDEGPIRVWNSAAYVICRLAPRMPQALPEWRARVTKAIATRLPIDGEYVATAMARMGASDDEIRVTFSVDPQNRIALANFATTLVIARRDNACGRGP